jgi:4-hydroxy-tetrahydrodipicolinate synthase
LKELYPLHGIVTVLNTPFTQHDDVDYDALKNNVGEALRAGVAGFLVPAMASEAHKLTFIEKLGMVEAVLETVNGQVPVFAGTAANSLTGSKDIMRTYLKIGCTHF